MWGLHKNEKSLCLLMGLNMWHQALLTCWLRCGLIIICMWSSGWRTCYVPKGGCGTTKNHYSRVKDVYDNITYKYFAMCVILLLCVREHVQCVSLWLHFVILSKKLVACQCSVPLICSWTMRLECPPHPPSVFKSRWSFLCLFSIGLKKKKT